MVADIFLVLVILTVTLAGYRKGIIMSLVTLLMLMLSCLGAFMAQQSFSDKVATWLQPRLETVLEEKMEDALSDSASGTIDNAEGIGITIGGVEVSVQDLIDLLSQFGLDAEAAAQNAAENAAEPVIAQYADSIAQTLADLCSAPLVFLLAFLACYLVLHCVELVVNLAELIPAVRVLDHAGGAIIGFLSAVFVLTILVSALLRADIIQPDQEAKPVFAGLKYLAEMIG